VSVLCEVWSDKTVVKLEKKMVEISYPVNDIYTSIQGEACNTGVPMVLVRLQGCDVGCPWCDTKETWHVAEEHRELTMELALGTSPRYAMQSGDEIIEYIKTSHKGPKWILVTGGEPARYDLTDLVASAHKSGYKVALETSGTETGHLSANFDWVCVSPKLNMPGNRDVLPAAMSSADEIKHVVGRQKDIDQLETLLAQCVLKDGSQVCLQPLSTSNTATELCITTATRNSWRLSIQLHKYISVR